jgi:hypothetical protein
MLSHAISGLGNKDCGLYRILQRESSLGGGGTGMDVCADAVQRMIDAGSIVIREQPENLTGYLAKLGNPDEFLKKYGLKRPEPKST